MIFYTFLTSEKLLDADIPVMQALIGQLVNRTVEFDRERVEQLLKQGNLLVARNEQRKIVGMATLYRIDRLDRTIGRVEDVVVDASTRGQGVGRGLMEGLIQEAKKQGISRLYLTSRPERVEANHLYQKLGFVKYETNPYKMDLN